MPHVLAQDLRDAVLQAAFEGKLTNRRETDTDVYTLLKHIEEEKKELVNLGKVEKPKKIPSIKENDEPFEIPETWIWERWGNLSNSIQYGANAGAAASGNAKLVRISDIQNNQIVWETVPFCEVKEKDISQYLLNENDILFARTGGTVGKSVVVRDIPNDGNKYIFAGYLIRSNYSSRINYLYLKYFMDSQLYWNQLKAGTIGSAQPNCNGKTLSRMMLPLPPIEEQARIVARVDELMAKIDEYEKLEKELVNLHSKFPGDMKSAILQAAFEGKLTNRRETDTDVYTLLKHIEEEKKELVNLGKVEKPKKIPSIKENDEPFEIPETWIWERWGNLSNSIQYGANAGAAASGNAKLVRISDIQNNQIVWETVPFCEVKEKDISQYLLNENDILFARTGGTVGKSVVVRDIPNDGNKYIFAGYLIRSNYSSRINYLYLKYFMESQLYWDQLKAGTIGSAQPNCNGKTLSRMMLPLPPIEEQQRIVEKIDQLLPLVERLDKMKD